MPYVSLMTEESVAVGVSHGYGVLMLGEAFGETNTTHQSTAQGSKTE